MYYEGNACSDRNLCNWQVETKKKGKSVPAPSGLAENGPLMQVRVTVPDAHVESLKQKRKPVPSVDGHVMIDTGAMRTAIDIDVARKILRDPLMCFIKFIF